MTEMKLVAIVVHNNKFVFVTFACSREMNEIYI